MCKKRGSIYFYVGWPGKISQGNWHLSKVSRIKWEEVLLTDEEEDTIKDQEDQVCKCMQVWGSMMESGIHKFGTSSTHWSVSMSKCASCGGEYGGKREVSYHSRVSVRIG